MADENNLVRKVIEIFGNPSQPEFITIRPYLKEDPYVVEIETRFKNKKRKNLDNEDVGWLITDIIWLSNSALQYFFPKVLEFAITKPLELRNFDLFMMQLADKKMIKKKFGFINISQANVIYEILQFWQSNEKLLEKFSIEDELKKGIEYWKKRAKLS